MRILRGMATRFVNLDRETSMFLPYDLRDWVPADYNVHFILDAVEQLPKSRGIPGLWLPGIVPGVEVHVSTVISTSPRVDYRPLRAAVDPAAA